jgi:NADPH-dependent curcumin reductase CurA
MSDNVNRQIRLAARPVGLPRSSDWSLTKEAVPEPGTGQVLVKTLYISIDPAMRGWMNEGPSYIPGVELGAVMRAITLGKVLESRSTSIAAGDYVSGMWGAQEYALSNGTELTKIDPQLAPLPKYLSLLGIAGLTAYFGFLRVAQPKSDDTVVVSGAAGSVGALVGQLAKMQGCRAVGIAGGPHKCRYIRDEAGFDSTIDYKAGELSAALRDACPDGVDVFFDNVGGPTLDAVLAQINVGARISLCGAISLYNDTAPSPGLNNYLSLLINRSRMEGFIVLDYAADFPTAIQELAHWHQSGALKAREHIIDGGLPAFPDTLMMLFKGENFGKLMLKLADD